MTKYGAVSVAAKSESDKGGSRSGEFPSQDRSRAVVGDHPPPSIRPIPRSPTPCGVQPSVGGGWWVDVVRGPGGRFVVDRYPAAGHGGPGSRDVTGRRFHAPNTGLGERRVQGGARSR
jgi:hypothetical protein